MSEDQHTGEKKFIEEGWFKDSPEGLVLVGSKCDACGKVFFPKKKVCPNCFEGQLREVPLSKRGKLHSYTLSILGPPDMEKPFLCGFIDLPEGIKLLFSPHRMRSLGQSIKDEHGYGDGY